MATQIVMDHAGDTRHRFDADDLEALAKAEERFKSLTAVGFTAAARDSAGTVPVCTENPKSDHSGGEVRPRWRVN